MDEVRLVVVGALLPQRREGDARAGRQALLAAGVDDERGGVSGRIEDEPEVMAFDGDFRGAGG